MMIPLSYKVVKIKIPRLLSEGSCVGTPVYSGDCSPDWMNKLNFQHAQQFPQQLRIVKRYFLWEYVGVYGISTKNHPSN